MTVFALWSAPRARSTAFFRSVAERGDVTVLHEPFSNLRDYGETDAGGRTFGSPASLLAWLRDETQDTRVFLKDTGDHHHHEVLADRRFLAEARHAFLIRHPEEIAASYYALFPGMSINSIGLEKLCELQAAVRDAGGNPSVVIDSDDLVARPEATMAAYCALGANGGLTGHPASYMDEWPDTDQETTTIMDAALGHVPRMCLPAARRE